MAFQFKSAIDDLFKPPSRLQSMIDRAVRPEIHEPDIPLNLDICDLVNKKKGNYPHDAVFALLPYINGRSNGQAYLALALLDYLVKNCGHPVHFQVASREFLNDLFRRFPEFQPTLMNPVHHRILEMLQEWRLSLCRLSRYKEDLQRINDMYSLLRRKGWRFPDVDSENIAVVIGPENTLKSREEMEKEDLEAMQAKLQELLRRATPKDLREANKLMKIITGYEQSSKRPDYDKEWEKELKEIENKTKLFIEMLQNVEPNTHMSETINLLKAACGTSQHRLRQIISDMCGSGSDAEDSTEEEKRELARLTTIEETIAEGLKAYDDLRRGIKPTFGPIAASGSSASAAGGSAEKELIALDDDDAEAERPSAPPKDAAAMYKRPGYDAERVAEMQNAGAKVKELERLLRSADPQEPVSAALRKARAECTASLAMLQELAQEQKNYAQYNDNENRELARMFMMRDRIQAAIAAYEDLKNGKTPQIPVSPTQPSSNGAAKQSSSSLAAAAAMPLSPIDDLAGLNFVGSTPPLSLPMTPGMNTPGLSVPIGGTSTSAFKIAPPPSAHGQAAAAAAAAMTNPSLPTSSAQARLGKATESDKKDAFDFSDLVAAAKSVQETPSSRPATRSPSSTSVINSAKPNMAQTTTWGASPDPSKSQGGGNSLIDFMS